MHAGIARLQARLLFIVSRYGVVITPTFHWNTACGLTMCLHVELELVLLMIILKRGSRLEVHFVLVVIVGDPSHLLFLRGSPYSDVRQVGEAVISIAVEVNHEYSVGFLAWFRRTGRTFCCEPEGVHRQANNRDNEPGKN